jgi:tRNA nucleotidyltransferase (CCA-adding enzyme)
MQLILTHEQADFDALAALLAARLLEPDARAVLPRRLNRNVRAFLALYGDDLPVESADDLPRERIERVTLVDTQSMPTIRGVDKRTQVHVVDHHPLHKPLPAGWTAVLEPLGATTTLLTESLQSRGDPLPAAAATLLLLGIYEDTGSLSYAATTPRDIRAAAWLLDQGASLTLASDFLNHPLSAGQRELYDRLMGSVETLELQGQRILVAQAAAPAETEEISTVAHKLRDLFDPDGLFVLVDLGTHIQLVARSTTDCIDVAEIAARFGGGGHGRAAAALIRGQTLAEARTLLLDAATRSVKPPMQVGQIYSPQPQVVDAALPIEEAAERMTRYGYEGFPVVRDGKVVGLLTRRAVDRAVAHGMKRSSVESVMEGGAVTVAPGDSITLLQRLMVEHGWGQIPVVAPEDGRVVGIVTRTDLLKALAPGPAVKRPNLGERIAKQFPESTQALLRAVATTADRQHLSIYLVGGVVRDLLLGIPSYDLDLVVEGDAIALARAVAREYGGRVRSHDRFGTAKWLLTGINRERLRLPGDTGEHLPEALDLVSARAEFYAHPTALPQVERGNLKLDLHRRDFTINTLALSLNASRYGNVYDFWGGLRDLEEKRIRVLHSISFIDDPTRILRAVRLEQRLGFAIEPRTMDLIALAAPLLHRVSGDRIRHELEAIFDEPEPRDTMARLQELGILEQILPALGWTPAQDAPVRAARSYAPESRWAIPAEEWDSFSPMQVWLFTHSADALPAVLERLNIPRRVGERILDSRLALDRLAALPPGAPPSRIVDTLEDLAPSALAAAFAAADARAQEVLDAYLTTWRGVHPVTTGAALQSRGLPPGPRYRRILRTLRKARLDGQIDSPESEERLLDSLLHEKD